MSAGYRKKSEKLFLEQKFLSLNAKPGPHEFILVLDRLEPDFNPGKIYRSADAFGCREVQVIGMDHFDPLPSKGSFKHVLSRFHGDFTAAYEDLDSRGYSLYALMPEEAPSLFEEKLPKKSAFILGNETHGISFELSFYPKVKPLRIPQFGNPQSLNVSIAASIAMYEWVRQHAADRGPLHKATTRK